ncbi:MULTISPECIES: MaoC family dehydratase N-terminal domain-containing protein [Paraburkholderia]|uniref:MaoC family dehydratase N-terminal domain-containing protein n=1 Tax=Paraburkholderia madseniana TaxID=2599607 RepID=A0AAP5BKR9_9BURK|nr:MULTISPECIES: MaoC family dehydratase N-terminal domain-containing protein [Paraburkholderia]MCX4149976.1 MaoC family dehydratase N-terminal domain-containing protein [Paraburkholderia madseniana]MDN7152912.1 MaoC family dehydratase N-terminal domain-containing protein [Paraburkholderia sp. WS6]MDQ6411794.1 MaoC family dehydratase N-terminal domain-containing protein [Paraburkholderia madseniana]
MSWGTITDERIAEAETLIGVPLRRDRMQWIETATRDAIRHFAWSVGDNNPLWFDRDYARKSPHGDIVAPPCILYAVDGTVVAPKLSGVQWIYAGTSWTWFEPVRIDDTFRVEARLVRQDVKSGRRFSQWVLQIGEVRYYNQHDRLVAIAEGRCARTPRGDKLLETKNTEAVKAIEPHRYTAQEVADIENQILAEPRTGDRPLWWEDVQVGDSVPQVVKGPLNLIDIMAWYAAQQGAQPYGGVHGDAIRYRRRHQDYHINAKTGTKESAGRGHLETSTGRDVGMGGAYDIGPQRISWAQHMLTNWIGDHGFLHTLNVDVLKPNVVGDTIWWRGKVTGKSISDGAGIVTIEIEATNQLGQTSAKGTASVMLPSRERGKVKLPVLSAAVI